MDLSGVPIKNPKAAYRIYDGKATVVLPERAEVNVLNEVGSVVWDRIDGKRTVGEILQAVLEAFEVSPEAARRDVLEFIATLRENGMVS